MTEQFTFFWNGPFSQWHMSDFTVGDMTFNCAEQWMMYQKATMFDDTETANAIMLAKHPREQKKLGRQVKNFDINKWSEKAKGVVMLGNYYKFTQDDTLLKWLLETKGTTLVEASPYDTVWGIGLAEADPLALDRATWKGTNWLGEVLTELREALLAQKNYEQMVHSINDWVKRGHEFGLAGLE